MYITVSSDSCTVHCSSKHCCVFLCYEYSYIEKMADDDDDVLLLIATYCVLRLRQIHR